VNLRQIKRVREIYKTFHDPSYLFLDPLGFVHGLKGRENIEIGSLVCSALAYGRVEQIRKSIDDIFKVTGKDIILFCARVPFAEKKRAFSGFKHRFNSGSDIATVLECAAQAIDSFGSIEGLFASGFNDSHKSIKQALDSFVRFMRETGKRICMSGSETFAFLFPAPSDGSTCKRLNMFLRWMIRPDDGIDLGLWNRIGTEKLIMPVDTHVAAVASGLGMTKRKTIDWVMAEEITAALKSCDPDDPVRFDFSLCRSGMIDFRSMSVPGNGPFMCKISTWA